MTGAYEPRPIRALGLWEFGAWRLKAYAITLPGRSPRPEVMEAARRELATITGALPREAPSVGFCGVHEGRGFVQLFLNWWAFENELFQVLRNAPEDAPTRFGPPTPRTPMACVWELRIMAHERQAWIEHVLSSSPDRGVEAYLQDALPDGEY